MGRPGEQIELRLPDADQVDRGGNGGRLGEDFARGVTRRDEDARVLDLRRLDPGEPVAVIEHGAHHGTGGDVELAYRIALVRHLRPPNVVSLRGFPP
jgi:hypothetical protein